MKKSSKSRKKRMERFGAIALSCVFALTCFFVGGGDFIFAGATVSVPEEINDLGYLGRSVNLLRTIDTNDKSDDLLSQNHLVTILDDSDLSGFEVSKDMVSTSYGKGFTSKSFASLALAMGVDLSVKASASTDFVIGSAKMETGFSMGLDTSLSASAEIEYTIYNYQKYLDSWTLNWDNGGIMGSVAALREHLRSNVYGALTDSFPQYTWSPKDFFDTYGTHIIVSYKRGGEYTFSSMYTNLKISSSVELSTSTEASGSTKVSSFADAEFKSKVDDHLTESLQSETEVRTTSTYSRGSSQGQLDVTSSPSINSWGDGVDDKNAQVLSSGLTLIAMWDLLPSQYAERKTELQNYYNEQVAAKSNSLLNKFVYKTVNEGDFDYNAYDKVISSARQLNEIRNDLRGNYILACDIDMSAYPDWQPIGSKNTPFRGIFDGNGNTISNLNIHMTDGSNTPYVGLFGYNTGTIKNLSVEGNIELEDETAEYAGGIVGYNGGKLQNCHSNVDIHSNIVYEGEREDVGIPEDAPTLNTETLFSSAENLKPRTAEAIPAMIGKTTVLDLRSLDGTEIGKTITLGAGARGIRVIGDPDKVYSGIAFFVENSEQDRVIALQNMHFAYTSADGAISTKAEKTLWIVSEGNSNEIKAATAGIASTISAKNDVVITGNAKLTISGASGVTGEKGADGASVGNASGITKTGPKGKNGSAGITGGRGGTALSAARVSVALKAELRLNGGLGGQGGQGGNGSAGGKGSGGGAFSYNGGNGGEGGSGGKGGNGGLGGDALVSESLVVYDGIVVLNGGKGGNGGNGGSGGNGGNGGNHWGLLGNNGSRGLGGQGGSGGNGGLFGSAISNKDIDIVARGDAQIVLADNDVGLGGNGGAGGAGRSTKVDGVSGEKGTVPDDDELFERVKLYTANALYTLYDGFKTYEEALGCVDAGAGEKLISIHSENEQKLIEKLFTYHTVSNEMFWLGAKRNGENVNSWTWADGNAFFYNYNDEKYYASGTTREAYTNWKANEPDSKADKNQLAMTADGLWFASNANAAGGYVSKRSLDIDVSADAAVDLAIGGLVGFNHSTGTIEECWSAAQNSALEIATSKDVQIAISGISGVNAGRIVQSCASGAINATGTFNEPTASFVLIKHKIARNVGEGSIEASLGKGTITVKQVLGTMNVVDASNQNENNSQLYSGTVESTWSADRVRVVSLMQTLFTEGELLTDSVIELTYMDGGVRKTSKNYSFKYDFNMHGSDKDVYVTAIKLSYVYGEEEQTRFVPVEVVKVKMEKIEIDLTQTKTDYQYNDVFEYPILRQTMSDGMVYSVMADEECLFGIPEMTEYGPHTITVVYDGYEMTYKITIAQKVIESTAAQLKIQNRTSVAGGEVVVQFSFANMPAVKSVLLHSFIYDRTSLGIVEGRWKVEGAIADWDAQNEMATFTYDANTESNTYIFELVLKVKEGCPAGDYTISCSALVNASSDGGSDRAVTLDVAPGNVSVIDVPRGDFNDDGFVDDNDAVYLLRYTLFGGSLFSLNQSGDMNGDDTVNSDDAIYLLRYTLLPDKYPLYW